MEILFQVYFRFSENVLQKVGNGDSVLGPFPTPTKTQLLPVWLWILFTHFHQIFLCFCLSWHFRWDQCHHHHRHSQQHHHHHNQQCTVITMIPKEPFWPSPQHHDINHHHHQHHNFLLRMMPSPPRGRFSGQGGRVSPAPRSFSWREPTRRGGRPAEYRLWSPWDTFSLGYSWYLN